MCVFFNCPIYKSYNSLLQVLINAGCLDNSCKMVDVVVVVLRHGNLQVQNTKIISNTQLCNFVVTVIVTGHQEYWKQNNACINKPCSKLNSDGWFWFQKELIASVAWQKICFTDTRVTDQNN